MTPDYITTIALRRAGIHTATTPQKTAARDYLTLIATQVEAAATWRCLFKVGTITTADGTRSYALASDCMQPIGRFFDTTNNRMLRTVHPADIDEADPDQDLESEPTRVALTGISATTGYWNVDLLPTPDTSSETLKYRYYATHAALTSSDDDTDLAPKYPLYLQSCLLWGTSAMYKGEKENDSEAYEWRQYGNAMKSAIKMNDRLSTLEHIQMPSDEDVGAFRIHGILQVD